MNSTTHSRRMLTGLAALVGLLAALVVGCVSGSSSDRFPQKLVILGFDGLDPTLVERWIADGKLPTLARLVREGGLYRLGTTHSPESPSAWASFATGVNPGKHNVYNLLTRDKRRYAPELAMVAREPARFLFQFFPLAAQKFLPTRGGTSFWVAAGRAGVRSSILTVPVTFPPEEVPNGELLAGLPLPDIRGTMGTYYYFATDLNRSEEGSTESGGILKRLVIDNGLARTELVGPPNPILGREIAELRARGTNLSEDTRAHLADLETRTDIRVPLTIRWNRDAPDKRSVTIEIQDHSIHLSEGEWSRWIQLEFRANFLVRLHGAVRMFLIDAGQQLRLYVSPVNWQPDNPPAPISSPSSFSADVYERLGPYRTLGWEETLWPLDEGRIDEKTFMDDLYRAFDDRAQVILNRIDSHRWDLVVGVIESTDRVQHMMWRLIDPSHPMFDAALVARFGDSIERVYRRCDQFVAQVLDLIEPGTPILVVSDHGFHAWRRSVNLNTWLVEQGFMMLRGGQPAEKKLNEIFGGGQFWENVDWSRTRAYTIGFGQIYFNLRGRESRGIVNPGAEYRALADELVARLMKMTDPDGGRRIIRNVYKRDEVYAGPYVDNAPDLQVGMEDGYRVSWQTALGAAPAGVVHPNMRKWSGDHSGYDYETTAGTLIASRKLVGDEVRLVDIAPTVMKYFGLAIPANIDGRPLF